MSPGFRPCARLVVNADDFGISQSINDGIARAHREGIVTATSLMAGGRAFDHAVAWCRSLPTLDVGAHLTLVAEKPLLKKKSTLTGADGRLPPSIRVLLGRLWGGRISRADIQAEWSAQIERILASGIRVTHLDSHQHLHALPGIGRLTLNLARDYHIPFVRVPIEDRMAPRSLTRQSLFRSAEAMVLRGSCLFSGLNRRSAGEFPPPQSLGFQEGGSLDLARLQRLLRSLRPGRVYELMCHPGLTPVEPEVKRWRYHHREELGALSSPVIRAEIAARNIRLCTFAELSGGHA
ncbi:MAG: ChbG/HpnK family deacetylase [Pseudomonadota bacterium]